MSQCSDVWVVEICKYSVLYGFYTDFKIVILYETTCMLSLRLLFLDNYFLNEETEGVMTDTYPDEFP